MSVTTPLDLVLARLPDARQNGVGHKARCPAHDDQKASLSINQGDQGAVLHCHAGCATNDVLAAIGLEMTDLFDRQDRNRSVPTSRDSRKQIVKTYDYVDANGTLLYQTVRYRPKDFRQRRPDGKGGWTWNLQGVKRVLYELPELLAADPNTVVFKCEGEKDTDAVRALGAIATTNVGGAAKWSADYSAALAGRHVVLLPHNDTAGAKDTELVARSLYGLAASVKVVELPGRAEHGDAYDWIGSGGDREQLMALAEAAPAWTPPNANERPATVEPPRTFPTTDLGNAERLVHHFGRDLRYSHKAGKWIVWNSQRWCFDESGRIYAYAKRTARLIAAEAAKAPDDAEFKALLKHARTSEGRERIKAMVDLAQSETGIPVDLNDLDANPMLLTVENGTIDLHTGQLREHRREDLITKLAPVRFDPRATCPTWRTFLSTIMADANGTPRRRLIAFLRRMVGYTLTGLTIEQALFMLYGTGSNGKSTFLETCRAMLGHYAVQTDFGTFLHRDNDRINNDLARLMGIRFVSAVEVESGKRLSESLVKQVTGGDAVTARFLFREFFEFNPTFKILLAANHRPLIRGGDHAIWRRLRLVPFTVTIADQDQDKRLPAKLRAELPGILAWAVKGCLIWQRKGLGVPEEVKAATSEYREEMDVLGSFIAECCVLDRQAFVSATALYKTYSSWCEQQQDEPVTQTTFGTRLTERGIDRRRSSSTGRKEYVGIRILTDPERSDRSDRISSNLQPNILHEGLLPENYSDHSDRSGFTDCNVCRRSTDSADGYCGDSCRDEDLPL